MPSFENTSASRPSSTRPLMTCTRGTPASHAATAWRALETWAGATVPFWSASRELVHRELAGERAVHDEAVGGR